MEAKKKVPAVIVDKKSRKKRAAGSKATLLEFEGRKFFAEEDVCDLLIEFSRKFGAGLSRVEIKETAELLDLDCLVEAICEEESTKFVQHEVVAQIVVGMDVDIPHDFGICDSEEKEKQIKEERKKQTKEIKDYINEKLNNGETPTLAELRIMFPEADAKSLNGYLGRALAKHRAKQGVSFDRFFAKNNNGIIEEYWERNRDYGY